MDRELGWHPEGKEIYEEIMRLLPEDFVSPYQVYKAGKKVIGKKIILFLKKEKNTPWGLEWDDLLKISESMPAPEGPEFWNVVAQKRGITSEKCLLCWRSFRKMHRKQSTCDLHSSKNTKEYFRLKRLRPTFEKIFLELLSRQKEQIPLTCDLADMFYHYPNVDKYLSEMGLETKKLRSTDDDGIRVFAKLVHPASSIPDYIAEMPLMALKLGDILPRAEAWLSLLDPLTGKSKGWGGRRSGSGRKSLSPSCHPESSKLTEIEGDRAN